MALTRVDSTRAERLERLAVWYGIAIRDTIDDCENSAEEDVFSYLYHGDPGFDAEEIHRWCAVTSVGEHHYLYPLYDERGEAEEKTVEYPDDNIYTESPVAVVDLDGTDIFPDENRGRVYRLVKLVPVFE